MGLAGAAGGASNVIKQILAERALAQQQAIENAQAQAQQARADEQLGLQRGQFEASQATARAGAERQQANDAALDAMANDPTLPEPVRKIVSLRRRGINVDVNDVTPKPVPPPTRRLVAIKGPKGEKIEKALTDEELAQGVEGYVAPPAPREPKAKIWVTRGGMPVYIDPSQVQPGDAPYQSRGQKTPTGADRQAFAFFNRAKNAIGDIEDGDMESQIAGMGLGEQTALNVLPNFMQSQLGQSYRQAQRAFTEARLRKESGAAINDAEYAKDAKTYFAQPGDTPDTIKQKRAARQQVLEGLAFAAGPAYEEYYGEPFKRGAGAGHADAGGGSGRGGSKYQVGQAVTLRDGRTVTIKKLNPDGTFEY